MIQAEKPTERLPNLESVRRLERQIRLLLWLFLLGLVVAGATAIPLVPEIRWLAHTVGADRPDTATGTWLQRWLFVVQRGAVESDAKYPFLSYGTDWLAFGHFAIAIAFWGPIKDPVKNLWVVEFGLIACVLVIPYALVFGAFRGIPFGWRLIDCSFGVLGFAILAPCLAKIRKLESMDQ